MIYDSRALFSHAKKRSITYLFHYSKWIQNHLLVMIDDDEHKTGLHDAIRITSSFAGGIIFAFHVRNVT